MKAYRYVPLDEKDFLARMAKKNLNFGQHWLKRNFNPWNVMASDCLIRATSAAIMMKYADVCKHLGVHMIDGVGQDEKITALEFVRSDLKQYFSRAIGIPRDDFTLDDFCEYASAQAPDQIFVAFVNWTAMNEGAQSKRRPNHAVYVCSDFERPYFIDNNDSGSAFVYMALQVKKQVPSRSRERLTIKDFNRIQALDNSKWQKAVDVLDYITLKFQDMAESDRG